ncbi:MAG: PP2C family protein-serine/threonine phosphatase [Spirochaeta sp.]
MKWTRILLTLLLLAGCSQNPAEVYFLDRNWSYLPETERGINVSEIQDQAFLPLQAGQRLRLNEIAAGGEGFVWLKTDFSRPPGHITASSELLGLVLGRIAAADTAYLNGTPIGRTGDYPPVYFSAWNTLREYSFPAGLLQEKNTLLLRIYTTPHEGFIVGEQYLAPRTDTRYYRQIDMLVTQLIQLGFALCFVFLGIFQWRVSSRDVVNGGRWYLSLLCFSVSLFLSRYFITLLPGYEVWTLSYDIFQRIAVHSMVYVIAVLLTLFIKDFLRRRDSAVLVILMLLSAAAPVIAAFVLPEASLLQHMSLPMLGFLLPFMLYMVFMLLDSAIHRNRDAFVLLLALLPLAVAAAADLLLQGYLQQYHLPRFAGFGLPLTVGGLLFAQGTRRVRAYSRSEDITRKLEHDIDLHIQEIRDTDALLADTRRQLQRLQTAETQGMQAVARLQQRINADPPPVHPPWQLGAVSLPVSSASSQLHDFYTNSDELLGCTLLNLSGRGLASSIAAMLAREITAKSFSEGSGYKLSRIMQEINRDLSRDKGEINSYMTGILLRVTGTAVELVNAGFTDPLLRDAHSSKVHRISVPDSRGSAIGVPDLTPQFPVLRFVMKPGDLLVLYSHSLVQSSNTAGQPFGMEGIMQTLSLAGSMTAQEAADRLCEDLVRYAGNNAPLTDDLSILTLRRMD